MADRLAEARGLVEKGALNESIAAYLRCLELDSLSFESHLESGKIYLRIGDFDEAAGHLQQAVDIDPAQADPSYYFAIARMRQQRWAEALAPLKTTLDLQPDHIVARWNLRIALLRSGGDLQDLESVYHLRTEPRQDSEDAPIHFVDRATEAGVDLVNMGRGSAWRDLDGDGWLDLYTVGEGSRNAMFRNNRDGTFTDITDEVGLVDPRGGWSALWIDYDNDADADLFVTRNAWTGRGNNSLYRNNGDQTFTEVTEAAGLLTETDSFCAAWADYDRDGWLDLYVANGVSQKGWPNALYRNNGDGTFSDMAMQAGVSNNLLRTIGVVWGDYDRDGWPDLYVVNFRDQNALYHNNGDGTFSDVTAAAGVGQPYMSFIAFFFDFNNDGQLDLYASSWNGDTKETVQSMVSDEPAHIEDRPALYRNNGDGTFTNLTESAGLARSFGSMAAIYGDVDYDGLQDIYLANGGPPMDRFEPDLLFFNQDGEHFIDLTEAAGLGNVGKGHGTSMADFDRDGDLDIYAPQGGMGGNPGDAQPNSLYVNQGHDNHWLIVELTGREDSGDGAPFSNRDAVGAQVELHLGEELRYAEVSGGAGFGVTNSMELEFGLGQFRHVDALEVRWPSGLVDLVLDIPADRRLKIVEAGAEYTYDLDQSP
ncbi:MAG: tetratricopeptide repeat protein [Gemmatimonadetes bacterium]|nr:tetratricopeptide repeat protein [Gemmatimonadota bacterium]MBT6147402.1 tetratricopeptide repeat protein [Gemmatimonadota bacterium]MBT7864625.1 tetratricopeptide repeat protein [Gemmatimonadota bacterium]